MKKVDILVLKAFFGPFLVTFFVVEFVFIMQFFYVYIDDFIGKGLPWYVVAELISYLSANTVPLALPLAILLSSIMTFGNLGERYELIALKMAGISVWRTALGLFFAIAVLGAGSLAFSNYIVPTANLKFWTTLIDISRSKPGLDIKEGTFYKDIEGYVIKADRKDPDQKTIYGVYIHDYTDQSKPANFIVAERGEMYTTTDQKYLVLRLINGSKYESLPPDPSKRGVSRKLRTQFTQMEKVMDISDFKLSRSREDQYEGQYQMLNITQLKNYIDSLELSKTKILQRLESATASLFLFTRDSTALAGIQAAGGGLHQRLHRANPKMSQTAAGAIVSAKTVKSVLDNPVVPQWRSNVDIIRRSKVELHRKYTSALACLVLFLIGAAFGAIVRKGGLALPLIAATFIYVFYLILYKLGESMAKNGTFDATVAMWVPTLIMIPLALFLIFKANTDSDIMRLDTYRLPRLLDTLRGRGRDSDYTPTV